MNSLRLQKLTTIFDFAIVLMVCKVTFSLSSIIPYNETIDLFLSVLSAGLFAFCILIERYNAKILILYAVISATVLYSVIKTGNYGFLITVIACFAVRTRNFDRMIKIIYQYEFLFLILHTLASLVLAILGKIDLFMFNRGQLRATFGFDNPNTFSVFVFNLILMWVWLNFKKINIFRLLLIGCLGLSVVYMTKTRTMLIDIIVLLLLCYLFRFRIFNHITRFIAKICIPILFVFVWTTVLLYQKGVSLAYIIDDILNARIKLGAFALNHFGVSILGQNLLNFQIEWDEKWGLNYFTFDCIYTYLMINQGYIWLIMLAVIFYKLAKLNLGKINIFLIVWALYGVTEVHGLNGFLCMPVFLSVFIIKFVNDNIINEMEISHDQRNRSYL
ncbi:hypothetical protein H6A71_08590 [Bifidobacterium pullorum subsp. saeculare]|uniref:hypothetical protein n=1 Tax=Bifidobacterium pullorum TaxID=78448 RepID=UPI00195E961F|nr:hypothetical protein [Bifidobacterium pullorum]MBM6693100.1 hypothetical protein [Bifidobacterium pullorum subsp. saeculare]